MLLSASGSGKISVVSPSLVHLSVEAGAFLGAGLVHLSVEVGAFLGAGLVQFSYAVWVHFRVFSCNLVQFLSY